MVYPRQLKLEMRQRQLVDIYGNNVKYTGPNPLSLTQTPFTLPNAWIDYSDFIQGLDKLQLSFSTTQTPQGEVPEGQFIPKKSSSDTLTFERDAYDFLKGILVDDVAAPLNQVEVQITDISGVSYYGYVIKSTDLSWCEFNSLCTFDVNIKQEDPYTECIQRTMIADNWQGMFSNQPTLEVAPGVLKKHPRFSYCIEHRPNGTLVVLWYITGFLGFLATIMFGLTLAADGILGIIDIVIIAINFIIDNIINPIVDAVNGLTGGSIGHASDIHVIDLIDPTAVFAGYAQLYIEAAGCGREHPAPLIRDYIKNVCDKCQVQVDDTTADIFFAQMLTVNASDGSTTVRPNPHYNACLMFPQVKRGIRRYASINLFGTSTMDTTTFYDQLNQPEWALSDMLDHLKKVYNAQWRVQTDSAGAPWLYFKRKDWFRDQPPLYDFSVGGADRPKLLEGVCYQPTEFTAPASMNGLYQDDPSDRCGHEASRHYNGDPLSFNNTINNPLFHGILDKQSGFGSAKFRLDGASSDYIYDAGQVVLNGELLNPLVGGQMDTVFCYVRKYCDYALTLGNETCSLPKIIIWDGKDNNTAACDDSNAGHIFLNARAMADNIWIGASETTTGTEYFLGKTAWPLTVPGINMPDPNPKYPQQVNPDPVFGAPSLIAPATIPEVLLWNQIVLNGSGLPVAESYPPDCNVIGHSLSFSPPVPGKYTVQNYLGTEISSNAAILVNWPMYFNPYYKDNLWDWFHWIDDPYAFPLLHKNWSVKIPLCKEDIQKLKADGDGSNIKLLQSILLDTKFYNLGIITDIDLSYDTGSESGTPGPGQYIELKGIV